LLSQFPARELDEPVTQQFVRAEIAGIRADVATLDAQVTERLRQQTGWVTGTIAGSLTAGMALAAGIAGLAD
jgi:hypothetical protein